MMPDDKIAAFENSTSGTTRMRRRRCGRRWRSRDETNALYEVRRCLSCGNCLEMRQLLRRLSRQRCDQARAGHSLQVQLRFLQGRAICAQECSCDAITMVRETI